MSEQEAASAQLDLIDMIWKGRRFVISVMVFAFLVGAVVYFFAPPQYRSEVEVTPLTGAKFAQYADFTALDRFGYTRNTLALEFSRYLTDRDRLALAAGKANAPGVMTSFRIKDADPAGPGQERAFVSRQMSSTYNDENSLNAFVAEALKRASRDLAIDIRSEIERRLAATTFLLKNDAEQEQLRALLDRSILSRPDQAEFASYSLIEGRLFPKALIIIAVALIVGLLVGAIGAVMRGIGASKRRFESKLRLVDAKTA